MPEETETDASQTIATMQERLRLEELISDISTILVDVPVSEIDSQIEKALKRIVEFLDIDRSTFGEFSEDGTEFLVTHSYAVPGIEAYPGVLATKLLPWYFQSLCRGEIIRIESPADFPSEAVNEKAYFARVGLKANLIIPFSIGGVMLCAIGFGSFRSNRRWPDSLVSSLKRVGEILGHSIYRKQSEQKLSQQIEPLKKQYQFEQLISNISARFVSTSTDQVDHDIENGLEQLLSFFNLDRCHLMKIERNGNGVRVAEIHSAHGIPPLPKTPKYSDIFPWHVNKLLAGETICTNVEELPPEADVDRRNLEKFGIRSSLFIPLAPAKTVNYVLTANSVSEKRTWSDEIISRIRLLGEIFTGALVRKSAQEELARLKDRLQAEAEYLRSEIKLTYRYEDIIGESKAIREVLMKVEQVGPTDSSVLITGETGTGKELIARAIHSLSSRKNRAIVKVDCGSLPATLIESELFGREKGAYTGALTKKRIPSCTWNTGEPMRH